MSFAKLLLSLFLSAFVAVQSLAASLDPDPDLDDDLEEIYGTLPTPETPTAPAPLPDDEWTVVEGPWDEVLRAQKHYLAEVAASFAVVHAAYVKLHELRLHRQEESFEAITGQRSGTNREYGVAIARALNVLRGLTEDMALSGGAPAVAFHERERWNLPLKWDWDGPSRAGLLFLEARRAAMQETLKNMHVFGGSLGKKWQFSASSPTSPSAAIFFALMDNPGIFWKPAYDAARRFLDGIDKVNPERRIFVLPIRDLPSSTQLNPFLNPLFQKLRQAHELLSVTYRTNSPRVFNYAVYCPSANGILTNGSWYTTITGEKVRVTAVFPDLMDAYAYMKRCGTLLGPNRIYKVPSGGFVEKIAKEDKAPSFVEEVKGASAKIEERLEGALPTDADLISAVIPLKNVDGRRFAKSLKGWHLAKGYHKETNTFVVAGPRYKVNRVKEMLDLLDQSYVETNTALEIYHQRPRWFDTTPGSGKTTVFRSVGPLLFSKLFRSDMAKAFYESTDESKGKD